MDSTQPVTEGTFPIARPLTGATSTPARDDGFEASAQARVEKARLALALAEVTTGDIAKSVSDAETDGDPVATQHKLVPGSAAAPGKTRSIAARSCCFARSTGPPAASMSS